MPAKLKLEWGELCLSRRLLLQATLSVMAAWVHLDGFLRDFPGASRGEYIIYSLTEKYYFLVLFPVLCLAWTGGRNHEVCRYPLLLRYRTRKEFFLIRFLTKAFFLLAALAAHVGILFLAGHSLPAAPQLIFVSSGHLAGVIFRQLLNLFCYVCVLILLYGWLSDGAGNAVLGMMLTAAVPVMDLLAAKQMLKSVIRWTPWGNIAYSLLGQEQIPYRFHGLYWLFLMALFFALGDELNRRKDYVFEETRRVG